MCDCVQARLDQQGVPWRREGEVRQRSQRWPGSTCANIQRDQQALGGFQTLLWMKSCQGLGLKVKRAINVWLWSEHSWKSTRNSEQIFAWRCTDSVWKCTNLLFSFRISKRRADAFTSHLLQITWGTDKKNIKDNLDRTIWMEIISSCQELQ